MESLLIQTFHGMKFGGTANTQIIIRIQQLLGKREHNSE